MVGGAGTSPADEASGVEGLLSPGARRLMGVILGRAPDDDVIRRRTHAAARGAAAGSPARRSARWSRRSRKPATPPVGSAARPTARGRSAGSGMVEGAIEQSVNCRMKRTGARRRVEHVGPLVELIALADQPERHHLWNA